MTKNVYRWTYTNPNPNPNPPNPPHIEIKNGSKYDVSPFYEYIPITRVYNGQTQYEQVSYDSGKHFGYVEYTGYWYTYDAKSENKNDNEYFSKLEKFLFTGTKENQSHSGTIQYNLSSALSYLSNATENLMVSTVVSDTVVHNKHIYSTATLYFMFTLNHNHPKTATMDKDLLNSVNLHAYTWTPSLYSLITKPQGVAIYVLNTAAESVASFAAMPPSQHFGPYPYK